MARRLRIGLTGGIASGKSAVSARFLALGVPVIDADESARRVVAPATPGLAAVVQRFGDEVLDTDGLLDRRRLRTLIFSAPEERRALESILHPLIRADMENLEKSAAGPYVVMAIPLLIEGRSYDRIDRILVIDVPTEIQVDRLRARDGSSSNQALAILAAQASREQRLEAADDVLTNAGTMAELWRRVDELHQTYLEIADAKT